MLAATAAHVAIYLGEPPERIQIRTLLEVRPGLRAHLKDRGFKRNSIRTYCCHVGILLQRARELGWAECSPQLVAAWREVREVVKEAVGCKRVVDYAMARRILPRDFTEAHLAEWGQAAVDTGFVYEYVRIIKARFRRLIFEAGLNQMIPGIRPPFDNSYGVAFDELPNPLHDQVIDLLKWKMAEFAPGRPRRAKFDRYAQKI
jgi:hypothetical protein